MVFYFDPEKKIIHRPRTTKRIPAPRFMYLGGTIWLTTEPRRQPRADVSTKAAAEPKKAGLRAEAREAVCDSRTLPEIGLLGAYTPLGTLQCARYLRRSKALASVSAAIVSVFALNFRLRPVRATMLPR